MNLIMNKPLKNGLATGMMLQLAIGPVFFFIINLVLQKSLSDGLAGVAAVTLVDYFYIGLAIMGVAKLLENRKIKKIFGVVSSLVLIVFGGLMIGGSLAGVPAAVVGTEVSNPWSSFGAVFLLTISSPMTIIFFTSLFTAKALEYNYTKNQLIWFGLGAGLATFLFMGSSVLIFSLIKTVVPQELVVFLNMLVGGVLIVYGGIRLGKLIKN